MQLTSLLVLAAPLLALAKTDLEGCTSSQVIAFGGASLLWYVPGTGEICSFLDCGGGRAPPKTTVPGCPQYVGTGTVTHDATSTSAAATSTSAEVGATSNSAPAVTSTTESSESPVSTYTTSPTGTGPITTQPSGTSPIATILPVSGNNTSTGLPSPSGNQTSPSTTAPVVGNSAAGLVSSGSFGAVAAALFALVV